jgi:oxaloacetate decarboxylase gamma subunit
MNFILLQAAPIASDSINVVADSATVADSIVAAVDSVSALAGSVAAAPVAELSNWDKFTEALLLMGIGMITVFMVLLIIILLGKLLILIVNKFFPEEAKPIAQKVETIDANVQEAINKAIMAISGGKKQAQKIEKI